jgi:hypothetical protein
MAETFVIKYGATLPTLVNTFGYVGGPPDLTGSSGVIKMRHQFGDEFEKAVTISNQATYPKRIEVPWEVGDVAFFLEGTYYVEYHITFPDGKLAIFPTEGEVTYDRIEVQKSLVSALP